MLIFVLSLVLILVSCSNDETEEPSSTGGDDYSKETYETTSTTETTDATESTSTTDTTEATESSNDSSVVEPNEYQFEMRWMYAYPSFEETTPRYFLIKSVEELKSLLIEEHTNAWKYSNDFDTYFEKFVAITGYNEEFFKKDVLLAKQLHLFDDNFFSVNCDNLTFDSENKVAIIEIKEYSYVSLEEECDLLYLIDVPYEIIPNDFSLETYEIVDCTKNVELSENQVKEMASTKNEKFRVE